MNETIEELEKRERELRGELDYRKQVMLEARSAYDRKMSEWFAVINEINERKLLAMLPKDLQKPTTQEQK